MRLEHADITASSAFSGRQAALNVGIAFPLNRTARISASSSTRRGRIDTVRHRNSRRAYSRFSSSIPSRERPYVSSNVFGKSFNRLRMFTGNVQRSLSTWQTTHRNLQDHVSAHSEVQEERRGPRRLTCHPLCRTEYRRQVVCPLLSISACSGPNKQQT